MAECPTGILIDLEEEKVEKKLPINYSAVLSPFKRKFPQRFIDSETLDVSLGLLDLENGENEEDFPVLAQKEICQNKEKINARELEIFLEASKVALQLESMSKECEEKDEDSEEDVYCDKIIEDKMPLARNTFTVIEQHGIEEGSDSFGSTELSDSVFLSVNCDASTNTDNEFGGSFKSSGQLVTSSTATQTRSSASTSEENKSSGSNDGEDSTNFLARIPRLKNTAIVHKTFVADRSTSTSSLTSLPSSNDATVPLGAIKRSFAIHKKQTNGSGSSGPLKAMKLPEQSANAIVRKTQSIKIANPTIKKKPATPVTTNSQKKPSGANSNAKGAVTPTKKITNSKTPSKFLSPASYTPLRRQSIAFSTPVERRPYSVLNSPSRMSSINSRSSSSSLGSVGTPKKTEKPFNTSKWQRLTPIKKEKENRV